jgi:hypothetical protein
MEAIPRRTPTSDETHIVQFETGYANPISDNEVSLSKISNVFLYFNLFSGHFSLKPGLRIRDVCPGSEFIFPSRIPQKKEVAINVTKFKIM